MTLYCWGSTTNGELGLGGIEEEHVNLLEYKHLHLHLAHIQLCADLA